MNKKFMISVITPYNDAESEVFERSLGSVAEQSIGFENIEYVIVMREGDAGHIKNVKEKVAVYPNVKILFIDDGSYSPAAACEHGLMQSSGEYIVFLSTDAILYPDTLEKAYRAITEEQAQICMFRFDSLVGSNVVAVHQYSLFDQTKERIVLKKGEYDQKKLITGTNMTVHSKMFERAFLMDEKLIFDYKVSFAEEGLFNITCFAFAEKIVILPQLIGLQHSRSLGIAMQSFKKSMDELWDLCLSLEKMAERGWEYGLYMDAFLSELSANIGTYILCSDVRYPFIKKAGKKIRPVLDMVKPMDESKIASWENQKTVSLIHLTVFRYPIIGASVKRALKVLHVDLEKIIKEMMAI